MEFQPTISHQLKEMDGRIFYPEKMGYVQDLRKKPRSEFAQTSYRKVNNGTEQKSDLKSTLNLMPFKLSGRSPGLC